MADGSKQEQGKTPVEMTMPNRRPASTTALIAVLLLSATTEARSQGYDGQTEALRIVVLGNSLTTGAGLLPDNAFPARLQEWADSAGWNTEVIPSGVNGATSADALGRLDDVLRMQPDVMVVAVGGNDALQGRNVREMAGDIAQIIRRSQNAGAHIVLAGMEAPPNYGAEYTMTFRNVFRYLGNARGVVFMPFLLDGVAGEESLNQADGIHPNEVGASIVAENLWPYVDSALRQIARARRR